MTLYPLTEASAAAEALQDALLAAGKIRVMWRDDEARHQIRVFLHTRSGGKLAVSCTCRVTNHAGAGVTGHEPLEVRTRWETGEAQAVYRAHLAEVGAA
jgi:hypothetical protein